MDENKWSWLDSANESNEALCWSAQSRSGVELDPQLVIGFRARRIFQNIMGKYKALQTHNLLLAKHNDENDFESNLNTLQEKDEAGPKLATHHFETCNMRKAVTTLPDSGTRFLPRFLGNTRPSIVTHCKMFFSPSHVHTAPADHTTWNARKWTFWGSFHWVPANN